MTTRFRLKRSFSLPICAASVAGSAVLPPASAGACFEHRDRDRAAVSGAQQADDQLRPVAAFVAAVAVAGEFAMASFEVARRDIIKHQRAFFEMTTGERLLDEALLRAEPVEGGVDLARRDGAEAEGFAEGMTGGGGVEHARGRQFGRRIEQPRDDQGKGEITPPSRCAAGQQVVEADAARGGQRGEDVTMRKRTADLEAALAGGDEFVAAQDGAEGFDLLGRPAGEVGQGAGFDLAVLAVAFAEQDGRGRATVGDDGDEHEPSDQVES
jgi:hypothetical protein